MVDLRGKVPDPGLGLVQLEPVRPPLNERIRLWDLAIKIGRELGTEVDDRPPPDAPAAEASRTRRRRPDFGPDRS